MTRKHLQSVNCLDKQSGFSIEPVAQYCSVAHERVKAQIVDFWCGWDGGRCTFIFLNFKGMVKSQNNSDTQ